MSGCWTEGQTDSWEQSHDRAGHDVGTTVSHHAECFGIAFGDQLQRHRPKGCEVRKWPHGVDD